jgi:hypothetical protein
MYIIMSNLIVDCFQHYPSLYYILKDAVYYTPKPTSDFESKYKFKSVNELPKNSKNIFIVFPLLNIDLLHEPIRHNYFYNILNQYTNMNSTIILIDNHDYDILPNNINKIKYDYILKRNFSREITYPNSVFPFPYVDCTCKLDPMYLIFNYDNKHSSKLNRVFWAGSEYNHIDNVFGRSNDRKTFLDQIRSYLYVPENRLPHNEFMTEICKSKYALSLAGCSSWGTRHMEILAANTLLLFQIDGCIPPPKNHIFPFEFEIMFDDHCMFTSGEDFIHKLQLLQNDETLYQKCLDTQNLILSKFFTPSYINSYIQKILLSPRKLKTSDFHLGYMNLINHFTRNPVDITYEQFCNQIDKKLDKQILVIEREGKIISTGSIVIEPKFHNNFKNMGHIEDIVTHPDHRLQSYGTKIIE